MHSMALASGAVFSELAFDLHANHQSRAVGPDSDFFITLRACAYEILEGLCSYPPKFGCEVGYNSSNQ
jgi:hypothetical protein